MGEDSTEAPVWVIRSEDGTEMRVPNLEKVRTWILTGVVSGQDEIRRSDQEPEVWRFVADLPELADLVGEIDVNNPTTKVADGPVHEIADLVNIDLSAGPPPLPEDGELEDAMAPTHALEIPSEEDIEAMLPGNIVYEVPLEPAKDATVTEMTALDLSDFEEPDPLGPVTRTRPASWDPSDLDDQGETPTIEVELPRSARELNQGAPRPRVGGSDDTSPGLLVSAKLQVEAAVAQERQGDKEPSSAPQQDESADSEDDDPEPEETEQITVEQALAPAGPNRVDLPLSRPVTRKAGAMGGGVEALDQAALEDQQQRRNKTSLWIVGLILILGGGAWWALGMNPEESPAGIDSALVGNGEEEARESPSPKEEPAAVAKDEAAEPEAAEPEAAEPEAAEPEAAEPEAAEPEAAEPEAAEPEAAEPEAAEPEAAEPEAKGLAPEDEKKERRKRRKRGSSASSAKDDKDAPATRSFDALMRAGRKAESGSPGRAAEHYQRALDLRPKDPDALGSVGRTLFRSGKNARAIEVLKRCRSTRSRFGPCMYWLGRAYEKSGKGSEAKKLYEKYLAEYPDGSYAAKARQRLGP